MINTLFCVANNFYPPTINFTWTRNKAEVTEGVENLRYIHNNDGTFHRISRLLFTPLEGDVYECSVQHQASEWPVTKSWGESRFCSVAPLDLISEMLSEFLVRSQHYNRLTTLLVFTFLSHPYTKEILQ